MVGIRSKDIPRKDIPRKDILRPQGHTLINLTRHRPGHILRDILRKGIPHKAIRQLLILVNMDRDPGMEDLTGEQRYSWGVQQLLQQLRMEQAIWGTEASWAMEATEATEATEEAMEATTAACQAMGMAATMASTASSSMASSASTSTGSMALAVASSRSGSDRLLVYALGQ